MSSALRVLVGVVVALLLCWAALVAYLVSVRPKGSLLQEALRLLPDTLRLLRRLSTDETLPRNLRIRLWLLLAYLALPFDLVPDFIPVIGYADDVILVAAVLRSLVRRAGAHAIRKNWPGTAAGLAALWRATRLPGSPEDVARREGLPSDVDDEKWGRRMQLKKSPR